MVSLALTAVKFFKTAPRVRAQKHGCRLSAMPRPKSNGQASLRDGTYDESVRLGTCSRDPIGLLFSDSLYDYLASGPLAMVDPDGYYPRKTVVTNKVPDISGDPLANPSQPGIQISDLFEIIGPCGQVDWAVKFWKTLPYNPKGSFWVQHVQMTFSKTDCAGKALPSIISNGKGSIEYWEARQISTPKAKNPIGRHDFILDDHFAITYQGNCTKGSAKWTAEYTEIVGLIPRPAFMNGAVPEAGRLPASLTDPKLQTTSSTGWRRHEYGIAWNCCGCDCKSDASYIPGTPTWK